jgi:hypothetical protein
MVVNDILRLLRTVEKRWQALIRTFPQK